MLYYSCDIDYSLIVYYVITVMMTIYLTYIKYSCDVDYTLVVYYVITVMLTIYLTNIIAVKLTIHLSCIVITVMLAIYLTCIILQ